MSNAQQRVNANYVRKDFSTAGRKKRLGHKHRRRIHYTVYSLTEMRDTYFPFAMNRRKANVTLKERLLWSDGSLMFTLRTRSVSRFGAVQGRRRPMVACLYRS